MKYLAIGSLALLTACGGGGGGSSLIPSATVTAPTIHRITFIGDSITAGSRLANPANSYANLVASQTGEQSVNLAPAAIAASGNAPVTTLVALQQEAPSIPQYPGTVIIELGTNDIFHTSLNDAESAYSQIISAARSKGAERIILINLRNIAYGQPNDSAHLAITQFVNDFDGFIASQGLPVVDLHCGFSDEYDPSDFLPDFVHPDDTGNVLMAKHVERVISGDAPTPATTCTFS